MTNTDFRVQYIPDKIFWAQLANGPVPKGLYPVVMTLGNRMSFSYAPFNTLEGYADWNDPERALHYLVPPTPSPIHTIGYLIAPQLESGKSRRVFVAFFYGDGKAVLAETHPLTLLHKPLGLRLASGVQCPDYTFDVSHVVIKGDDAPIRIAMVAQNPMFAISILEGPLPEVPASATPPGPVQADLQLLGVLNITLRIPNMATLSLNTPMPGIV